jgi:hypothetical protein
VNIYAIGFAISQSQHDTIGRIAANVLNREIKIVDVRSFLPKVEAYDCVIVFGEQARSYLSESSVVDLLLPSLDKLEPGSRNESFREDAFRKLLTLKNKLDQTVQLTPDTLPFESLLSLPWLGKTLDGKSFYMLPDDTIQPPKKVDFILTLEETKTIMNLMRVLKVEEVKVGPIEVDTNGHY